LGWTDGRRDERRPFVFVKRYRSFSMDYSTRLRSLLVLLSLLPCAVLRADSPDPAALQAQIAAAHLEIGRAVAL
jgi:hypothetical protein